MQTVNDNVTPIAGKVVPNVLWQEMLLYLVGKVGSHKKGTAQIQDLNIEVHCSSALQVGGKVFKRAFHKQSRAGGNQHLNC